MISVKFMAGSSIRMDGGDDSDRLEGSTDPGAITSKVPNCSESFAMTHTQANKVKTIENSHNGFTHLSSKFQ